MITVRVKRRQEARLPAYAHPGDAGADLFAAEDCVLKPGERKLVSTGLHLAIPEGYEGQVRPKSGLAINHGIGMVNAPGTIDAGYRGEIKVILINWGQEPYAIEKGKKIAQLVFKRVEQATFEETEELDTTARDTGGFGSTGLG